MSPNDTTVAPSPRRLTWEQICAEYPDEWVVLVDLERTEVRYEFRTAVVLGHSKKRGDALRATEPLRSGYKEFAHLFTGIVRMPLNYKFQLA